MEWLAAAVALLAVDGVQFRLGFECTLEPAWSTLITGAPLSAGVGLVTATLLRRPLRKSRFPGWIWIWIVLLGLLGVPFYLLGHICG
jgi:hypothetical protein